MSGAFTDYYRDTLLKTLVGFFCFFGVSVAILSHSLCGEELKYWRFNFSNFTF